MRSIILMVVMVSTVAVHGSGMTYMEQPEYSAGTGTNSAYIALDFDYDNAFVFEYHWNGQATGWDALQALDQAGPMDIDGQVYSWGVLINDFSYPGGVKFDYGLGNTGWVYYLSDGGSDWFGSGAGVRDRVLSNGSWDSWVWSNYPPDWSIPYRQPGQMPIPEPTSLILLAFGAGLLTRKKA
jgi:hypothetical protein